MSRQVTQTISVRKLNQA